MLFSDKVLIKDINAPRFKHRALTGYLRRNWNRNPHVLKRIVYNTDVSPYIGALPPELRRQLVGKDIANVTAQFRENLEDFLINNAFDLRDMKSDCVYELPQLGNLFGQRCTLTARGGVNPWVGACGVVCKLSFPQIDAHYALKIYFGGASEFMNFSHGAWFEVATALAANKAEPRDTTPMYMASLKYDMYMLSKWAGDADDGIAPRENKNMIFFTKPDEDEARNRRGGRRIDWGETFKTNYGDMSYPARKLYRQLMNMDSRAVQKSLATAQDKITQRDFAYAMKLAELIAWYDDNTRLHDFVINIKQR